MTLKKITIKDFAEILGVSTATVSRAFSSKGRISDKTRKRITDKAKELGYRANIHARNLGGLNSSTIAMYYPELSSEEPDYFISEIIMGINNILAKQGKNLQINPLVLETPEAVLDLCKDQISSVVMVGIIIIDGAKSSREMYNCAKSRGMPCVIIGPMRDVKCNNVLFDNKYGAFLAGRYFKNTGHKHPAFIGGHLDKDKQNGFRDGLRLQNNEIVKVGSGFGFRHGYQALDVIAEKHPEVDCVLCANDSMAMGFIKAALTRKIKIPQDIAVIGYDDIRPARYYSPALSSVTLKP
ncbi:MAG: LacI family DNA-binding transcriptional regulator, partial [Victivallaceae bacterium]|nr:LacI family DNA-binding transcriptional regulator [Victivallaceae bacterium]